MTNQSESFKVTGNFPKLRFVVTSWEKLIFWGRKFHILFYYKMNALKLDPVLVLQIIRASG